jgi:transcriptional regulator with XRE-family HTH domain
VAVVASQPATGGPTVRRIMVGVQLRRLRESKGITRDAAGYVIRGSESKISRLELGRVGFKQRDIEDLLTLYGVLDHDQRESLLSMAREANTPGWWHSYDDVLPGWFQTYVGLEESAELIRGYEVQFVPGLLQTEDYARAVATSGTPNAKDEEIERRVRLRMTRQQVFNRPHPPGLWIVVDEGALRRPMGGRRVMRTQLERLLDLVQRPDITLQVMPFRFGAHAADGGAFSMLRFPERDVPDIVYVEQLVSALYLDKPEQVEQYAITMNRLTVDSHPPDQTAETLTKMLAQL